MATIISIHAPRERCDVLSRSSWLCILRFQSTHRVSDATTWSDLRKKIVYISIHAPRERCDRYGKLTVTMWLISIHAPRERCDSSSSPRSPKSIAFQSTHRVSDATEDFKNAVDLLFISIHAPRERCDPIASRWTAPVLRFQSTHRVSDATEDIRGMIKREMSFQSTHRVSDATAMIAEMQRQQMISIHAPRERCDVRQVEVLHGFPNFNPRTA